MDLIKVRVYNLYGDKYSKQMKKWSNALLESDNRFKILTEFKSGIVENKSKKILFTGI